MTETNFEGLTEDHVRRFAYDNDRCQWGVRRDGRFQECGDQSVWTFRAPFPRAFAPTWMSLCDKHAAPFIDLIRMAAQNVAKGVPIRVVREDEPNKMDQLLREMDAEFGPVPLEVKEAIAMLDWPK